MSRPQIEGYGMKGTRKLPSVSALSPASLTILTTKSRYGIKEARRGWELKRENYPFECPTLR